MLRLLFKSIKLAFETHKIGHLIDWYYDTRYHVMSFYVIVFVDERFGYIEPVGICKSKDSVRTIIQKIIDWNTWHGADKPELVHHESRSRPYFSIYNGRGRFYYYLLEAFDCAPYYSAIEDITKEVHEGYIQSNDLPLLPTILASLTPFSSHIELWRDNYLEARKNVLEQRSIEDSLKDWMGEFPTIKKQSDTDA